MEALYSATSVMDRNNKEETFSWLRANRKSPVLPYPGMIREYDSIEVELRIRMQKTIDQLFTAEEIKALQNYLQEKEGLDLVVKEFTLPIDTVSLQGLESLCAKGELFELWKEDDFDLSFQVEARIETVVLPTELVDTETPAED